MISHENINVPLPNGRKQTPTRVLASPGKHRPRTYSVYGTTAFVHRMHPERSVRLTVGNLVRSFSFHGVPGTKQKAQERWYLVLAAASIKSYAHAKTTFCWATSTRSYIPSGDGPEKY